MASSDQQALLSAIIQNPDEDTPRLMYADWLEEHDRPKRAEFIRVQIELDRINRAGDDRSPRCEGLKRRGDELLTQYGPKWVSTIYGKGVSAIEFRRGFVETVLTAIP